MCDGLPGGAEQGAGVSMDGNFSNANWVVTPGRDFFITGGVPQGEPLTLARYHQVQHTAERMGLLDGIVFRPELFDDKPPGMSDEDYRYDLSIGTDYAMSLGRGLYCARVPVSRPQMVDIVTFLNAKNGMYDRGSRHFDSSVFLDNCIHLAINALAAAGVMKPWPTHTQFVLFAPFDFPVPKNEFVNIARRANDTPMDDLVALYRDKAARTELLQYGRLPTEPGALVSAYPPHAPNDVFGTKLKLIFYDEPPLGPYRPWFHQIWREPRYTDSAANLTYFALLYARLAAGRRPLSALEMRLSPADRPSFAAFYAQFYARLATLRDEIARKQASPAVARSPSA
jgi:hypothetical protein